MASPGGYKKYYGGQAASQAKKPGMERPRTQSEYLRRQAQPKIGGKDLNKAMKDLTVDEQSEIKKV